MTPHNLLHSSEAESGAHAGKEDTGLNPGPGFCRAQLHQPQQCDRQRSHPRCTRIKSFAEELLLSLRDKQATLKIRYRGPHATTPEPVL